MIEESGRAAPSGALQIAALFAFVLVCLAAGGLGAMVTTPEIDGWYRGLHKPTWNPPDWIFGPVWTTLYIFMAVAAWWVWRENGFRNAKLALSFFAVQLVLNVAWSWIFFGWHDPGTAFAVIVVLLAAILVTTALFFRHDIMAGALMLPYVGWVSFASVLNYTIWQLNQSL